jgi:hypothetical protein
MPKRVDSNHAELVAAFRRLSYFVDPALAELGRGRPDVLIAQQGVVTLVEIKDGAKRKSARALTADEGQYHDALRAVGVKVEVVESIDDVMALHLALRRPRGERS